ncbi:MAG: ROK family protein [Dehalococcoidia bacterium]|nr:ROK family protein [Dehalococcoidia bacterium]
MTAPADTALLGLDFTSNALRIRIAELDGKLLAQREYPLAALKTEDEWIWEVGGRIATSLASEGNRRSALAIGVAAPGTIDPISGRLVRSVEGQEEWEGLAVVECLRRHIDVPVIALSRVVAGLRAERLGGGARGIDDAIYISLRGIPASAVLAGGHLIRGHGEEAGALPAVPQFHAGQRLAGHDLEAAAGLLADAVALLDPEVAIVDAADEHAESLVPLLQRVIDEVAPGPRVVRATFGADGPVIGALHAASTVAFEGERRN